MTLGTIEITVIMPVFNGETYLQESLDSLLSQTFTDFEILCINDASMDSTAAILERYWLKDERLRILMNDKRCGAACSRNTGIKEARGSYLLFLDADDWFEPDMLNMAFEMMENTGADTGVFGAEHYGRKKLRRYGEKRPEEEICRYCHKGIKLSERPATEVGRWNTGPCNKIYKKDFIQRNGLEFQDLKNSNDVFFSYMVLFLADRIVWAESDKIYAHFRDHDTPTRISFDRDPMCSYKAVRRVQDELLKRSLWKQYYSYFYMASLFSIIAALQCCRTGKKAEEFICFLRTRGIEGLRRSGGSEYDKKENIAREYLERFEEDPAETAWYQEDFVYFRLCLKANGKKLLEMLSRYRRKGKTVAVWGAGKGGRAVLEYCRENGVKIEYLIDSDKKKAGKSLCGLPVRTWEGLRGNIQAVLVSTVRCYDEIKEKILKDNGCDMEVVRIMTLLEETESAAR